MKLRQRITGNKKRQLSYEIDPDLDVDYYRNTYDDLVNLSDDQLHEHWLKFGKIEGRTPNVESVSQDSLDFDFELDHFFYLSYYPDLANAGIETIEDAKLHWLTFGKDEKRYRTVKEWIEKNNFHPMCDLSSLDFKGIMELNSELNVTLSDLLELSVGETNKPIKIFQSISANMNFYRDLGISCYLHYKATKEIQFSYAARKAWEISIYFERTASVVELFANSYLDQKDYRTAQKCYESALDLASKSSTYLLENLFACYEKQFKLQKVLEVICQVKKKEPGLSKLGDLLDTYSQKLYVDFLGGTRALAMLDYRTELKERVELCTSRIYQAYYTFFSREVTPVKTHPNSSKILIVGDYHIAQCIRYRIDQKVEQLALQGKVVTTIDWKQLKGHINEVALHDVVIFYRVPAVPEVLKAMAQVNACGKVSFYEIDDLLFEESYPASVGTFGGYVSLDTHVELRRSMASFYAAATCCRYGISSTNLLCEKLEKLVIAKQCVLHRNGLDKHNVIRQINKSHKKTIDIFYGSGTQAHNSDFVEQALPALEKILNKHKNARLIVAGYLLLPQSFNNKYKAQLRQVPQQNNIKIYWAFLEQADINLAVLNNDEINDCKSELKWIESACFSIPSVVSATANYLDVLENNVDVLIASNESEWFDAIDRLISQPKLREAIANNALTKIKTEYSLEYLGEKFAQNLDALVLPKTAIVKKKIALVNVFFPPQAIGGATRVVSDNFDVLQQQYGDEYELVVFTSDENCIEPYRLTTYQHQGVTVYRTSILHRENMDWHPKDPEMYKIFEKFLGIEQPDVVHFHCVQRLTASVVEAAKDMEVPYIITAHDAWWISDHQFLVDANNNVYPEGHLDIFAPRTLPNNVTLDDSIERIIYYKELLAGAQHILTVSESFAGIYRKNGYPEIQVNKNGISASVEWHPKNTTYTDKVVCAHIGSMTIHKGYFLLKDAIEKEQPNNIEVLIVDHSKDEGYEHKTLWGNVPVTFIGRVSQSDITTLYQKLDVLFAPSLWPESYGLVTREAAACGCWVVASDLGGIGEDVIEGKTGLKVRPDLPGICKAVKVIDSNASKFKQLIEQTDIRIVNKQVEELRGFYKSV